jgi:Periplasmic component of the Tol biopolymer transport system
LKLKISFLLAPLLLFLLLPLIFAADGDQNNNAFTAGTVHKIVFTSKRDGNSEIYTMNGDGSDLQRLTNTKTDELMPQWSPDAAKLLYLVKKGGKYEIWIMNSEGGGEVKAADDCAAGSQPSWSPDGSKIVYLAKYKSRNAIFSVSSNGGDPVRLTENNAEGSAPSWSPDGSKILYLQRLKDYTDIYTIKPDGTERSKLTDGRGTDMAPVWSPDGRKIAYIYFKSAFVGYPDGIIAVMNGDGTKPLDIIKASKMYPDHEFQDDFYWSPDGANFAYTKVAQVLASTSDSGKVSYSFKYGTYIAKVNGSDQEQQLAFTGDDRAHPSWSPDGTKVAYLFNSKLNVYTLKTDAVNAIPVNVGIQLSPLQWSPDGTKILFAGKSGSFSKATLYLVTLDGKVTLLSANNDSDPQWTPLASVK